MKADRLEQPKSTLFQLSWIVISNLKVLTLERCHSLKVVFSTSVAEQLLHLQTLEIRDCGQVEYIVGGEGKANKTLILPMLTMVSFGDLPDLESFCVHDHIFLDWSSLEDIDVYNCPKIRTIIGATHSPSTLDKKQVLTLILRNFYTFLMVLT